MLILKMNESLKEPYKGSVRLRNAVDSTKIYIFMLSWISVLFMQISILLKSVFCNSTNHIAIYLQRIVNICVCVCVCVCIIWQTLKTEVLFQF